MDNQQETLFREMPICKGRLVTLVDCMDYEWLSRWYWTFSGNYVVRNGLINGKRRLVYMAPAIIQPPPGFKVDHINGNTLDNRRSNLRCCTTKQNAQNRTKRDPWASSPYKGVEWLRERQKYRVRITVDGQRLHLGWFTSELEAADAYDRAARVHFGEFAHLNFPDGTDCNSDKRFPETKVSV